MLKGFFTPKKIGMLLWAVLLSTGCSSPKVKVNVTADQALNQDNQERSLPVVLRVYQLSGKTKFEHADFKQLWKQDTELLGREMLAREEYLVHPGQEGTLKVLKQEGAQYVGIVALFRHHAQQQWRVLKPVGEHFSSSVNVLVKDKSISMDS